MKAGVDRPDADLLAAVRRVAVGTTNEPKLEADPLPSGRSVGNIGRLSLGVLARSEYARHAVVCALLPLLHSDLYSESNPARAPESGE